MKKGFTLLELLIVISIIGILLGTISASFITAQKSTRDSRRKADLAAIQKSVEQCYALSASYPAVVVSGTAIECVSQTTMTMVPVDPKNSGSYIYTYTISGDASSYCLCGLMEKTERGNADTSGAGGVCSLSSSGSYYCLSNQQ